MSSRTVRSRLAGSLCVLGLVGVGVSAGGCGSPPLHGPDGGGGGGGGGIDGASDAAFDVAGGLGGSASGGNDGAVLPIDRWHSLLPPAQRKLDILVMVDNSQSMLPLQAKLLAGFPAFVTLLKALPLGLPDLHLAVISSDTGPGKYDLPDRHCGFRGDGGRFQSQPRGSCTTAPLATGQTFLSASANQTVKNYTGDLTDAFACIAALGDQGCGFEGQLKSVRWALDPRIPPDGNQGFLRPDSTLVVILVTNEDDCSLPDDSDLVDPTQVTMSSALGPLWSYRCNEFGHLCDINGMLQPPPRGPLPVVQGCVSNDSPSGKLTKLAEEVRFLKTLRSDPNQLIVAAIDGPAEPYSVEMIQQGQDTEAHPNIRHSCTLATGEFADPAVRIQQWVGAFGVNGIATSICADSFVAPLQQIADKIATVFGPVCLSGAVPEGSGSTPPVCRVVDRVVQANGQVQTTLLPQCAAPGAPPPCWELTADAAGCAAGTRLSVNRGAAPPPAGLSTEYDCAPCAPGSTDLGCR